MLLEIRHIAHIFRQLPESFRDSNNGKIPLVDYSLYLIIPVLCAILLVVNGRRLNDGSIGVVLTALSIFAGFLINMLIPFFNIIEKTCQMNEEQNSEAKKRLKQYKILYNQVSFTTLLSLITIILLLLLQFLPEGFYLFSKGICGISVPVGKMIRAGLHLITYWGLGTILLSLFSIVVSSNALIYSYFKKLV